MGIARGSKSSDSATAATANILLAVCRCTNRLQGNHLDCVCRRHLRVATAVFDNRSMGLSGAACFCNCGRYHRSKATHDAYYALKPEYPNRKYRKSVFIWQFWHIQMFSHTANACLHLFAQACFLQTIWKIYTGSRRKYENRPSARFPLPRAGHL